MVKLENIKIKRKGFHYFVYRGKKLMGSHMSLKQAKVQTGALKRVEIKKALRKLGIKKMPKSLMKQGRGYGNY